MLRLWWSINRAKGWLREDVSERNPYEYNRKEDIRGHKLTRIMCKYFLHLLKMILACVLLSNIRYWATATPKQAEFLCIRVCFAKSIWVAWHLKQSVLWFCGQWHFLFAWQAAGSCQVTPRSVTRAKTCFDAKSLCTSLYLLLLRCGRFLGGKKILFEWCLQNYIHACMHASVMIPGSIHFKLSPGCETWTAALADLNQWWVTIYDYWSASINSNIHLQEDDKC